ncbi:MAG: PBP1A family penicillin-binding protein [Phascolarctobacterium sp.]|nr:PBP1A family penicillin-binding protein [Phascolarctobacterium sp.]
MFKAFKLLLLSILCLVAIVLSVSMGFSSVFAPTNMDEALNPDAASQFFDNNGNVIYTTYSEQRRIPITFDKIPKHVRDAFIAIEDNRFYEHGGVDIRGTARALVSTLSGQEVQGGSTITQQLAKNAFLTQERSIKRKIKEAFIARELEKKYTKDEILTMYLNQIYFGHGTYGLQAASQFYFGKDCQNLDIAEAATLAAIPKSPNYYNPFGNREEAKKRRMLVIDQMVKYNLITKAQGEAAKAEDVKFDPAKNIDVDLRGYFYDMIIAEVIDKYGADALYKGGLKIYTTLDPDMQKAAENSIHHLPTFYTDGNKLTQPQVALVAVDPRTGFIKAMIGGRGQDKFNRATMAVRQPGSSFKPFVYLTAMQKGMTPATVIEDKAEDFGGGWTPKNSSGKEHGKVSVRQALVHSYNIPTVKIARKAGTYEIVKNAEAMGITTLQENGKYSDNNLAMSIGGLSKGVSPIEMASAYGVLARNGKYVKASAIKKIVDRDGKVLYENKNTPKNVVDAGSCYLVTNMLQDVLISGTAGGMGIGRPAAGKTGTTDSSVDAWFVGYTPDLSCAVWFGDDNNQSMGNMYGSGAPLSIWHNFMINALANVPASNFVNPGVTVPPPPEIKQDEKEELDENGKPIKKDKDGKPIQENKKTDKPTVSTEPQKKKSSTKEKVKSAISNIENKAKKVIVGNKPTKQN